MRSICRQTRRPLPCLIFFLPGIIALGCDRPLPMKPYVPTEKRILWLVEDIDDRAQSPNEVKWIPKIFAPGHEPSPETLARYSDYRYEGQPPVQSGDSATVVVVLKDAKTDEPAGEVQWSMTKINDIWRLTDAPLPAK